MSAAIRWQHVANDVPPSNDVAGEAHSPSGGVAGVHHHRDKGDAHRHGAKRTDFTPTIFGDTTEISQGRSRVPCEPPRQVTWQCRRCGRTHTLLARCEHWWTCSYCHSLAEQGHVAVFGPVIAALAATHEIKTMSLMQPAASSERPGAWELRARAVLGALGAMGRSRVADAVSPPGSAGPVSNRFNGSRARACRRE